MKYSSELKEATVILEQRHQVYENAKAAHPERWNGRNTRNWSMPEKVYLNPEIKVEVTNKGKKEETEPTRISLRKDYTIMTLQEAKEYFINDRFAMVTTGIDIEEIGDHYAKCSLKIDDRHTNATGHVMGGAIFTLADFTFAVTTNTPESVTVTVTSQISYLSAAKGDTLYSESKVLKDGRRNCFYEISITDNLGNLVAVVNTSGVHL